MTPAIAEWIQIILVAYAAVGVVFALVFVARGVASVDPGARQSTWGFRILIFPGSAALWPLLLRRWVRGETVRPERNAHRDRAASR